VLTEHAGRIVTQNQIVKQVWAGPAAIQAKACASTSTTCAKNSAKAAIRIVNEPGIGYRLEES
jgi:DNA-binding response OmpR family regulator